MESGKLGNWLQIGANIGILGGLVLVGVQIMQSNGIAAAELFGTNLQSTVDVQVAMAGENPNESMYRVMLDPRSATPEDYFVADRIYGATLRQLGRAHAFSAVGLYGDGPTPEGFVQLNHEVFACPYGLAYLDSWLARLPDMPQRQSMVRLRELAAANSSTELLQDRLERVDALLDAMGTSS